MVADLRSSSKSREDITKVTSVGGQNLIGNTALDMCTYRKRVEGQAASQ